MTTVELAEYIIRTCPELMGMCRTAETLVQDTRVTPALMERIEDPEARARIHQFIVEELRDGR